VGQSPSPSLVTSIGFSGSGFLLVYHLGVLQAMTDHGLLLPNSSLAGLSGGALVSVLHCTGVNLTLAKLELFQMITNCAQDFPLYCFGTLDEAVANALEGIIPMDDSFAQCSGGDFTVEVSSIVQGGSSCLDCNPGNVQKEYISSFTSREDLITVLRASAFVSGVSGVDPCNVLLRGQPTCDGGYSIPQTVPCPITDVGCLRVSCHQTSGDGNIFPGIRGPLSISASDWNALAFDAVGTDEHKEMIYETGYQDAVFWMQMNGY
jgi:hypothetical protein